MSGKAFFITGTDTGVGKTAIACALLERARQLGLSTAAVKPVAAGAQRTPAGLRNDDALQLMQHMTLNLSYDQVNPVCFEEAIAPHLAALKTAQCQSVWGLKGSCRQVLDRDADLTLIEGAGGWLVPVNDSETLADLAKSLKLPVIMVVGMRLGCINHALLTAAAIERSGLHLAAWVANQIDPDMAETAGNLLTLRQRIRAPLLGHIPWCGQAGASTLAGHFEDILDTLLAPAG